MNTKITLKIELNQNRCNHNICTHVYTYVENPSTPWTVGPCCRCDGRSEEDGIHSINALASKILHRVRRGLVEMLRI